MFENLHGFFSYKFYNEKWKNDSLLFNFPVKAKRSEIIFRDLLKSFEKTDLQIISWHDSKLKKHERNNTIQMPFLFKLQEYSSNLEMLLSVTYPIFFGLIWYTFF